MKINEAIQKAIEGGWKKSFYSPHLLEIYEVYFLDPLFWQALGKAMGWDKKMDFTDDEYPDWKDYWHRFIDHLADGKSYENFARH